MKDTFFYKYNERERETEERRIDVLLISSEESDKINEERNMLYYQGIMNKLK